MVYYIVYHNVRTKKQPFFNLLTFLKQSGRNDAFSHVKRRLKPHFSTRSRCVMMSFEISFAPAECSDFSHSKYRCLPKTAYFFIVFQLVITDNVFIEPEPTSGIHQHRAWIEIYIKISKKGSSPIRSAKQTIMPIYTIIAGVNSVGKSGFTGVLKNRRHDLGHIIDEDLPAAKSEQRMKKDCRRRRLKFSVQNDRKIYNSDCPSVRSGILFRRSQKIRTRIGYERSSNG